MIRRPPRATRTDTLFPYTTLFRSDGADVRRICEDCLVAAQNLTLFTILPILPMGADPSGGAGACHPSRTRAREKIAVIGGRSRSEEHTSELQSLMRISYAVFCLKKKKKQTINDRCN